MSFPPFLTDPAGLPRDLSREAGRVPRWGCVALSAGWEL